jgi:CheY-like chemotaxis protein
VAHDFNNVLMAIRGNASLAAEELPAGHPVREFVAEIDRAGLRAVALVRQILTFARPEESARTVVPLGPVVDEALRLLRSTLPAEIAIRTTWQEGLPPVAVDVGQVHQAVVNLVTNAAHAIGRRPGRIDLDLSLRDVGEESATLPPGIGSGPYVCLSVRDDGCGMDGATLARVFDPFFTTKKMGEGTGLGLSIVHGIMRAHGGAVDLRSRPEQGTTVTLRFPAVEAPAEPAPALRPESARHRTERILVVDDDEAIAILSRRSLGRLGYVVTTYTDPVEAVAAFTRAPDAYDAVVTDISMPGMTGFDVAGALLAIRPGLPLVITSGYIRPEDEAAAVRLGVKALIAKPDTVDELAGVLDRIFQAGSA